MNSDSGKAMTDQEQRADAYRKRQEALEDDLYPILFPILDHFFGLHAASEGFSLDACERTTKALIEAITNHIVEQAMDDEEEGVSDNELDGTSI
jgi:hypothetical protein